MHDCAFGAGGHLVRNVGRDAPRAAGPELARLVADAERQRAREHHPELLVLVTVLGDDRVRLELDDAERDALAVDRAHADAVPDVLRPERCEVVRTRSCTRECSATVTALFVLTGVASEIVRINWMSLE